MRISYRFEAVLFAGSLTGFLVMSIMAAMNGPTIRHDDIWYIRNVSVFLETGRMTSNQVFPVMTLNGGHQSAGVTHNLPTMYLVLPLAALLGSYWGWILTNILFSLLTCLLLMRLLRVLGVPDRLGLLCGAFFLAFPTTVFMSSHALSEAGTGFLLALTALMLVSHCDTWPKWALMGFMAALVVMNRYSLIVAFLVFPLHILLSGPGRSARRLGMVLAFAVPFFAAVSLRKTIFPTISAGGIAMLFRNYGFMDHLYSLEPLSFSLRSYIERTISMLLTALVGRNVYEMVFMLPFNGLAVWALVVRAPRGDTRREALSRLSMALVAAHFLTAVVYQYQHRYLQVVFPVLLANFFASPRAAGRPFRTIALVTGVVALSLVASGAYTLVNLAEAREDRAALESYEPIGTYLQGRGPVLVVGGSPCLFNWAVPENQSLLIQLQHTTGEFLLMREKVPFRWMICHPESYVMDTLAILEPVPVPGVPFPSGGNRLYRFLVEP